MPTATPDRPTATSRPRVRKLARMFKTAGGQVACVETDGGYALLDDGRLGDERYATADEAFFRMCKAAVGQR